MESTLFVKMIEHTSKKMSDLLVKINRNRPTIDRAEEVASQLQAANIQTRTTFDDYFSPVLRVHVPIEELSRIEDLIGSATNRQCYCCSASHADKYFILPAGREVGHVLPIQLEIDAY